MEQNQFEGLEEIETEERTIDGGKPEPKEYEKLLIAEQERKLALKARNLVDYGCFNQVEETVLDFRILSKIDTKKYKGKYDLYQNINTLELVWICPLIEQDDDGNKAKKPYAYDCIVVESMDDETYQEVIKAANHNLRSIVGVCYKGGLIGYVFLLAATVLVLVYNLVAYFDSGNTFFYSIAGSIGATGTFLFADVVCALLLVLVSIKYKKYKNQ